MMDQEGTGVDLDLDAFEREELRTEARGRPEAGEKGAARTRGEVTGVEPEPAASSRSRIQAATVDGSRAWMRRPGEAVGKVGGGRGTLAGGRYICRYAASAGRWWAGLRASPCMPVPAGLYGPCPCCAMGQAGGPNTAHLRAVPAHGPCQMSGLRAVPATHGLDGNL
jgi:hypothetical protein